MFVDYTDAPIDRSQDKQNYITNCSKPRVSLVLRGYHDPKPTKCRPEQQRNMPICPENSPGSKERRNMKESKWLFFFVTPIYIASIYTPIPSGLTFLKCVTNNYSRLHSTAIYLTSPMGALVFNVSPRRGLSGFSSGLRIW